jgi:hypothetical protein
MRCEKFIVLKVELDSGNSHFRFDINIAQERFFDIGANWLPVYRIEVISNPRQQDRDRCDPLLTINNRWRFALSAYQDNRTQKIFIALTSLSNCLVQILEEISDVCLAPSVGTLIGRHIEAPLT